MKINIARWDSILRCLVGFVLSFWLLIGGPVWTSLGFYLIITGAWAFDPLYVILKIKTARIEDDSLFDPSETEP